MQRLSEAWRYYRGKLGVRDGALALISIGLARATAHRCQLVSYDLVAQPVPEEPLPIGRRGGNITVHRLTEDDPALHAFPRPRPVFRARFQQDAICYGAFRGNEPIGFIWFTLGPYEEDEVRCVYHPFPKDCTAWDFDVYVAPAYRLTGTFARLWNVAYAHMREHGIEWTVSRISSFNATSLSSHRRMGARDVGRLIFLSVGSLQLMIGSISPRISLSYNQASRPCIEVDVRKVNSASE